MLDWEAPTGGYLLSACFASGLVAGDGARDWLARALSRGATCCWCSDRSTWTCPSAARACPWPARRAVPTACWSRPAARVRTRRTRRSATACPRSWSARSATTPSPNRRCSCLRDSGVDLGALQRLPGATGLASIGVDAQGENQILVAPGVNLALRHDAVSDAHAAPLWRTAAADGDRCGAEPGVAGTRPPARREHAVEQRAGAGPVATAAAGAGRADRQCPRTAAQRGRRAPSRRAGRWTGWPSWPTGMR